MGFFRTVYTLCTRTSAFPEMLGTPVWRAILHSLLLALLCPFLVATVKTCREKKACSGWNRKAAGSDSAEKQYASADLLENGITRLNFSARMYGWIM